MRTKYILQLDDYLQNQIKNKLIYFLKEDLDLNESEIEIELELAMNSRVSDLEDTIDIQNIINKY